ncbi:MAG: PIN domain-containing protein [Burkholderiaceae bacterium]|nr:PIN domain-containing protein [Burkholderiaceae bacterium]
MNAVVDTNIWLDWLVFDEPSTRGLLQACERGALVVRTTAPMRDELAVVLAYPQFALTAAERARRLRDFDRLTRLDADSDRPVPTLACRDPSDQKFVDHALRSACTWLISRDRKVLALARRARRLGLMIVRPDDAALNREACSTVAPQASRA